MGEMIEIKSEERNVRGYLALPDSGTGPSILLMHAWWGLTDFFTSLADRLAAEGFVVLAPDLYGGKTASEIEDAKVLVSSLEENEGYKQAFKDEDAALDYLLSNPAVQGSKIAEVAFSMGAFYALYMATSRPEIGAVVLFYGGSDQGADDVSQTNAAYMGHIAENDEWESAEGFKQLEAQLKAAGRDATFYTYSGTGHWFFENNRPDVYNAEASQLAWERTVRFLHENLG